MKKDRRINVAKNNPVTKAFYPGLSACYANGKYYLVSSSFPCFPGIPLYESKDLAEWHLIGHVLTRQSQLILDKISSLSDVFVPTIRYHKNRFYVVVANTTTKENYYVYTDDIYGEWSEPITVGQSGMDPSLFFDGDHVYFMSNGRADNGECGIVQCEIDIADGTKLSESICIWKNSDGYYQESPHMYHIGDCYYLMSAEGCEEYGRMSAYAKSDSVWGPFTNQLFGPILSKQKEASCMIQGIGHGDLIQKENGEICFVCLGFQRMHLWCTHHILGREVIQIPVNFQEDYEIAWKTAR